MSEQEFKTREIVVKMQFQNPPLMFDVAKQCALICVDEIIENNKSFLRTPDSSLHNDNALDIDLSYWHSVKNEIEKL